MDQIFYLDKHEFVALCDLLKLTAMADSGGQAKHLIVSGKVLRNGHVEIQKTAKIREGEVITLNDMTIKVCSGCAS